MNITRRALDKVAHRLWDTADYGTLRWQTGEYLCWVASEWAGLSLRRG